MITSMKQSTKVLIKCGDFLLAAFNSLYYVSILLELVINVNNSLVVVMYSGRATHYHAS